jgi:RNA polymerase sigma factor (sigma-70 family)
MISFDPPPVPATADVAVSSLIAQVHAGDQAAARELVARARKIVTRIARAHRPRRLTEEDLTQEIFVKVFSRLHQYRGDAPFEHWVSRIAATTCLDQLRAQRCRPELRMADLSEGEVLQIEVTRSDQRERWPGQLLATRDLLHQLLDRLPPDDRKLIVWFELEEKTIAEIEEITGWNFNFIKMRLFRARGKLKRFYAALSGFDGAASRASLAPRWPRDVRKKRNPIKSPPGLRHSEPRPARMFFRPNPEQALTKLVLPLVAEPAREVA